MIFTKTRRGPCQSTESFCYLPVIGLSGVGENQPSPLLQCKRNLKIVLQLTQMPGNHSVAYTQLVSGRTKSSQPPYGLKCPKGS